GRAGHDGGLIIGAGDGDGDVLRDAAAMAVGDGDRVGDRERLAGGEEVERAVGDGVGPADGLGAVVDGAEAQRTRIRNVGGCAAALVPDRGVEAGRGGVQVGDVDVGKRDAAAGAVGGGRAGDAGGLVERGGR